MTRTIRARTCASLLAVAALLACATGSPPSRPEPALEAFWKDYLALPSHKAVAVAGSPRTTRWVLGAASGVGSAAAAREAALAECATRRIQQRIQAQCVLYADGEKIVWRGR